MRSLTWWIAVAALSIGVDALAGNGQPGSACRSGNDCITHRCAANICRANCQSKGGLGAFCENDCHCASKRCTAGKCAAPKADAKAGASRSSSTSRSRAPVDDREADVDDEPKVYDDKTDPVTLDDCGKDLRATVLTGERDYGDHEAARLCHAYKPATLATAKALYFAKYSKNFSRLAPLVEKHTAAELECAKRWYDGLSPEKKADKELDVLPECETKAPVDVAGQESCAADLVATVYKNNEKNFAKSKAKELCEAFTPEAIARTKKVHADGFVRNFQSALGHVKPMSAAEYECARAYYAKQEGSDRERLDFIRPDSCVEKRK